jgi:hypothetical protein
LKGNQIKKILHIQVIPKLSGVQRISFEILRNLPATEYDKYVLFGNDFINKDLKEECVKTFQNAGIKVLFSKYMYRVISIQDIYAFIEIYKLLKKEKLL